ncbi:MAG: stage V sporulation protein AB [Lachnospiraceae bacterium]|nr:stage V sporulation protein AB [Lachnospiraceae bacterium]
MWQWMILSLIGGTAGFVIASGTVAFVISLGMIPRFAGITKTAGRVLLYENCCILGALAGTVCTLWKVSIPLGNILLLVYGLLAGIFLGGWIIALGEVVDIYAILFRRLGLTRGLGYVICCMALGKTLGSLLFFFRGIG